MVTWEILKNFVKSHGTMVLLSPLKLLDVVAKLKGIDHLIDYKVDIDCFKRWHFSEFEWYMELLADVIPSANCLNVH